ncbi:MAG TPA: hypothetical protein VHX61_02520 [Rhizomicrobium sp.]|jgi:hypothetical protein|nr:hypothetical protein [Rhizomicrobium sp.]
MLVSMKYNFVFIAIPKCASTAMESALAKYADMRIGGLPSLKHAPYSAYEAHVLPFIVRQCGVSSPCEPFSIFREPLDWLFSWYRYRTRLQARESDKNSRMYSGSVSFADFLGEHFKKSPPRFARAGRQSKYIQARSGRLDAVTLYRYEDAEVLAKDLACRIGCAAKLSRENVSPRQSLELPAAQIRQAHAALKVEYEIYCSIPRRGGK